MAEKEQIYPDLRQGFDAYWQKTLYPLLKSKETLRKKYVARFWALILLALFVLPTVAIATIGFNHHFGKNIDPGYIFIVLAVFVFLIQRPFKSYKKRMKNDTMQTFIDYFKGFSYKQNDGLTESEIQDSLVFPDFDTCKADDCFSGTFQGVKLRLCEQILKKIENTGKKRRERIVFQGIAIEFDMNKKFQGQTIVLKDHGVFSRFQKPQGLERVGLEDPQFEKLFEVYSSNQIEARYILTPVFMERILTLKDLYKGKSVQLAFQNQKVLIAINTKQDMFEPYSFFKTNLNKPKIDTVFEQFLTVFSIIDILKLAQKVGL